MEKFDVVIVGGGAAGFFAAAQLNQQKPGLKILIAEKTGKVLSKVLVSGGGRCNVTHNCLSNSELVKNYPRGKSLLKKVFDQFSVKDTIQFFESRGIAIKTEADNRMFPESNNSSDIADCLYKNTVEKGVTLRLNAALIQIERTEHQSYKLSFSDNNIVATPRVILALGGIQKPSHLSFLNAFDIERVAPCPSLFTFNCADKKLHDLMGVAAQNASVKIAGSKEYYKGPVLITHWGVSGPAVLKTSAWQARTLAQNNYSFTAMINWINESEEYFHATLSNEIKQHPNKKIINTAPFNIPERLWNYLIEISDIDFDKKASDLSKSNLNKLMENTLRYSLICNGKTTFKEEFVTAGGIALNELNPSTCELKKMPGVYAIGEMTDVDGITGGFNFQAAWSMAYVAAKSISGI